ncbi:Lacal_2735 family protein [Reichenbachiella carrageenanivorans]|uniref:Lacal_2735 family protein n=1 Tax=Reichenbachiella carrageenanivorans TaxID=2979869 RepID=A0ABY6CV92_9BACT|nr:Lacal_2735 family protein [Reichenbachiella carrageenanivorans]UXX77649.1 Lacal_2735 family protein [Reichenbachiella carrageenanivorans]
MFNFLKKNPKKKLEKKYHLLLKEAHRLSTINRALSDQKIAEANKLYDQMNP